MYEYDRGLVFVSFDDAARLFHTEGQATGLRLSIPGRYNASDVVRRVKEGWKIIRSTVPAITEGRAQLGDR